MDNCPNCGANLEDPMDFYQDPIMGTTFYQNWHFVCPKCGKKWCYTEYWRLEHTEVEEEE